MKLILFFVLHSLVLIGWLGMEVLGPAHCTYNNHRQADTYTIRVIVIVVVAFISHSQLVAIKIKSLITLIFQQNPLTTTSKQAGMLRSWDLFNGSTMRMNGCTS